MKKQRFVVLENGLPQKRFSEFDNAYLFLKQETHRWSRSGEIKQIELFDKKLHKYHKRELT